MAVQPKPMRRTAPRATSSRRATANPGVAVSGRLRDHGSNSPTATSPAADLDAVKSRSTPDRGVGLMLAFTAATLLIVLAVAVVAIVDRWWVLIPVMLLDFAVTFGVIASIGRLLADEGEPPA